MTNIDVIACAIAVPETILAVAVFIALYRNRNMPTAATESAILATLADIKAVVTAYTPPTGSAPTDLTPIASAVDDLSAAVNTALAVKTEPTGDTLAISTTSLPTATIGAVYNEAIVTTGGTDPVTLAVTGLPAWLSFEASSGVLSGTAPSVGETDTLTFTATDATGFSAAPVTITLTVA